MNICHFIFGMQKQTEEFLFSYYIAVYSAYLINKPDTIYFYYHYEPYGTWYDKLKVIPNIKLVKIDIPTHIGNKIIKKTAHKADWVRMNVLYDKGGVYLDIDTICVKPWKYLLNRDVVLGKEVPNGICNAIMFSKPKSEFFKLWLDNYECHFNPDRWREASIVLPDKLSKKYPNLLTLKDPDVFFLPNWGETQKIFVDNKEIPKNLISLHLWESYSLKYMKNINDWSWAYENSHTMYGKILLNLIDNYIMSDSNYYFAHKSHFKKKEEELICSSDTFLKKSLKHSSELEENMKIKFNRGNKVKIINDFNDTYYLVSDVVWNWNSQKDQDYWVIHEIFDYKKNGFFVDLASTDGKNINNTYILEKKLNWMGICIEANPTFHKDLYKNRNCYISQEVVADKNDEIVKFRIDAEERSGIINKKYDNTSYNCKFLEKNTVTLESILDKYNAPNIIDYLSLDIEGAEYDVLKNFPFNKYTFLTLTIEGPSQLMDILLFKNDYLFVRKSKKLNSFDSYYIHKSLLNDKIKLEQYSLSKRRTYINRNKNLPKLHIIHRIDKTNTGDMVSNCSEYYSFEDYKIVKHDIYSPDFTAIKKNDPIILSGGGLLNCLEIWNKNINKLLELSENVFGWGIGFNRHHNTNISTRINLSKFKLLGIRDYKQSYESNTRYVPCSSCNLPLFKYEYKIQRNIGVIEHHHNKIRLKEKYDKINNELNIDDIIKFIGESNIIITNTYHALYFSALLNKKCILYNSFSEKFNHTKFHYINYKNNMELNENNKKLNKTQTLNKELLQNSIKINNIFYSDIMSIIN